MNDEQRAEFAAMVRALRRLRYDDKKQVVYTALQMNSATYDRIEAGLSVKPANVTKVVKLLWPEAQGDWRIVLDNASVGGSTDDSFVSAPGATKEAGVTESALLEELRAMRARLDRIDLGQMELSERVAKLEERGT